MVVMIILQNKHMFSNKQTFRQNQNWVLIKNEKCAEAADKFPELYQWKKLLETQVQNKNFEIKKCRKIKLLANF